uniref:Reverse transcriptase-like protein n=1 Tax=Fundulus heteroclitus TaxID=8078 RepID=A0A146QFL4_FUNHE
MQFGFRQNHSTETANCVFIETVKSLLDKTTCVGAVFLDFKKAFDTVDHQALLSKLTHFNFADDAIAWFKSYLSDRKQSVSVGGTMSSYLECPAGVPQGSILGPVLFSLYINDLPDVCQNVQFQMYADDAVIFTPAKSTQEASSVLTSALDNIQPWLLQSCLSLNKKKTVSMMFTKKNIKLERSNVFLGGVELELVEEFKYLGVTLDTTLSFKKHIKITANKIKYNIRNFKQIRSSMTISSAKMFLHSMIFSHIDYCITTYSLTGGTTLKPIEILFKKSLKIFDQKPLSFHQCNILEKYNMLKFENFIHFKNSSLIYKVLNGLAPPPLSTYIRPGRRICTRASSRGDLEIPHRRTTFGQTVLSVRGGHFWNSLPTNIRECPTYCTFKKHLKQFLKSSQSCTH